LERQNESVRLEFQVKDNGIGISKQHDESIFDPFFQVDLSSSKQYDGVGIGLSLCKQLVENMQGQIWLESEAGEGSTFFFAVEFGT
jgi:signal transduction histidine kinase